MTKEELISRIEKKEADIAKINKRIDKLSAKVNNNALEELIKSWSLLPYGTEEKKEIRSKINTQIKTISSYRGQTEADDLLRAYSDLFDNNVTLQKYKVALDKETNFENETKIQVLVDFLARWKEKMIVFITEKCEELIKLRSEYKGALADYMKTVDTDNLTRREMWNLERGFKERYYASIPTIASEFVSYKDVIDTDAMIKMLDKEVKAKYIDFVNRITAVVGEIQDVSNLRIGQQAGEINGYVIGSKGKAKVETISASGPIQRFHYRVLVHKIKE